MTLTHRDKRAIKLTAVIAAVILLHHFVFDPWFSHWTTVKNQLAAETTKLQKVDPTSPASIAKQIAREKSVPAFTMPVSEEKQRLLFEEKLNQQLKKISIKAERMSFLGGKKKAANGYQMLKLQTTCKCKFKQVMQLLLALSENPYLVGVEEFRMEMDKSKGDQVNLVFTVSTYAL